MSKTENRSRGVRELEELDAVLKALAHEARRRILVVLNARGGSMTAGEIAGRFSCSWPTMSRHLGILEAAELVVVEQHGRERNYKLNAARLHKVVGGWLRYFNAD